MSKLKIYAASSWNNPYYKDVVQQLVLNGYDVYDFTGKMSTYGNAVTFHWSQIDSEWESWTNQQFVDNLSHPNARHAFSIDHDNMQQSQVCVLILPCGKSSHMEAGFMKALGKKLLIYMPQPQRAELTYSLADDFCDNIPQLLQILQIYVSQMSLQNSKVSMEE
jgi:hypothetical protein